MVKKLFLSLLVLILLACLAGGGSLYWLVVLHPGDEINPENIDKILGKESPVFYNDGTTRLGVFFDQAHRQYVPYEQIPVNFINALVASEDNRFFSHFGFDLVGILRATIKNIQARRIVQGGSTLTQQTAKNLFKRENRSLQAKLKELLFALRLEYHYSKEKIFEFYANQFYVSGNGHGLGVAARYYFDKKPEELGLLECAYIAGSVKRPNYYNPFIKKNSENTDKALERGKIRVNYVLAKMFGLGMISEYQYGLAKLSKVEFNKGQVGYSLDYVMEMVKDAVTSTEVIEALEEHDITNVATSGVRIITTVNKNLQEETLYALRHDLSRIDVRLRGYEHDEVQEELKSLDYKGDNVLKEKAFLFGVVKSVPKDDISAGVEVFFGRKIGSGTVDRAGLSRLVTARLRWKNNPWSVTKDKDYTDFLTQLKEGDRVWVSVRNIAKDQTVLLDLEKFPKVNGGALVLRDGIIKAMAGGVENRFFNRAISAKRTMGSSFKPFVFTAALQLGWNAADRLRNKRDVFVFQNQPYFPRPDHHSPYDEVSMSWAGVHSENVASVWLLSHLCDKLNLEQFKEVAEKVGLAPRSFEGEEEPYSRFRARIRDRHGIVINLDVLGQAAFKLAVKNVETDLIFEGRDLEYSFLQNMHYGLGFKKFGEDLEKQLENKKLTNFQKKELSLRLQILTNNFLSLEKLHQEFVDYVIEVENPNTLPSDSVYFDEGRNDSLKGKYENAGLYYNGAQKRYCFIRDTDFNVDTIAVDKESLKAFLSNQDQAGKRKFWEEVYLNNTVTIDTFDLLKKQIDREMKSLKKELPYSMEVLANIDDFRIIVGLKYLIALAHELGIDSDLEPVLSFPLGSNVVTLLETLRMYEGLVSGEVVVTGKSQDENKDLLCIIDRIESDDGEVLYQPQRVRKRLLAPETTLVIGHVLENIVKYGTGRYADKNVKLTGSYEEGDEKRLQNLGLSIPVLGKTGTANRYTNASFFGYLPGLTPSKDELFLEDGYAVGVYVGFDNNKEMRKGATKITGSGGALPTWTEIVNGIVKEKNYGHHLDPVDLSFYGLGLKRSGIGQVNVAVAPDNGGIIPRFTKNIEAKDRYQPSIMTFGKLSAEGAFQPERKFLPFWKVSGLSSTVEN